MMDEVIDLQGVIDFIGHLLEIEVIESSYNLIVGIYGIEVDKSDGKLCEQK